MKVSPRQALIWLKTGKKPVSPDQEVAIGEWDDVTHADFREFRKQLLLLLRQGLVSAHGYLTILRNGDSSFHLYRDYESWELIWDGDWESFLKGWEEDPLLDDPSPFIERAIPPELWSNQYLNWNEGKLHYDTGRSIQGTFDRIEIDFEELEKLVPANGKPNSDDTKKPSSKVEKPIKNTGRPAKYDWAAFYVEIAVIADLNSLPDTPAELEKRMLDWCNIKWGEIPGESTVREKIAPIYDHPRKAGKARK